jgi:hypothetical protein
MTKNTASDLLANIRPASQHFSLKHSSLLLLDRKKRNKLLCLLHLLAFAAEHRLGLGRTGRNFSCFEGRRRRRQFRRNRGSCRAHRVRRRIGN